MNLLCVSLTIFHSPNKKKHLSSLSLSLYYSSTLYSSLFFSHLHCLISFNQSKQNKTKKTTLGLLFSSKSSWLHTQQHTNSVVVMCGVIFICESERWSISVKFFHFSFPSTITSLQEVIVVVVLDDENITNNNDVVFFFFSLSKWVLESKEKRNHKSIVFFFLFYFVCISFWLL
jgi:hypothetical protein